MNPPSALKIGPLTYSVRLDHQAITEYNKASGTDCYGVCQNRTQVILVDEGYPLDNEQRVLLHETVHAIHTAFDIDPDKTSEEHYVTVFSSALLGVMHDNPDLVAYLMQGVQRCA